MDSDDAASVSYCVRSLEVCRRQDKNLVADRGGLQTSTLVGQIQLKMLVIFAKPHNIFTTISDL